MPARKTKRRITKPPSAKQLAARAKFVKMVRAKAAKKKACNPVRRRNKTIIRKAKKVIVLNPLAVHVGDDVVVIDRNSPYYGKKGHINLKVGKLYYVNIFGIAGSLTFTLRQLEKASRQNPKTKSTRRKYRNGYLDLVIMGHAKKTPEGWSLGGKRFAFGKGIVPASRKGYYLDKATGTVFSKKARNSSSTSSEVKSPTKTSTRALTSGNITVTGGAGRGATTSVKVYPGSTKGQKRAMNAARGRNVEQGFYDEHGFHPIRASKDYEATWAGEWGSKKKAAKKKPAKKTAPKKRRNISQGFFDGNGVFHPIRSSSDYDGRTAGETGKKPVRTRSKKRKASLKKASQTARHKAETRRRKSTTSRLASRSLRGSSGILKRRRSNPTPAENRREFAGKYSGEKKLYFPDGTPAGLSKLGKLVLLKTQAGTIKPAQRNPAREVWLCRDQKGKLHLGTTSQAPLYNGPAGSLGEVSRLEYQEAKPHLGYKNPTVWFHKLGEETGERPTLYSDGKGGLKFRGGKYRIESRGIVN